MKTKTCGECRYYVSELKRCNMKKIICNIHPTDIGCSCFERKPKRLPTNGDVILAGGIKSLVKFHLFGTCDTCIYYNKEHTSHNDICLCPKDKTCADGIESWLNAPAESERGDE